MSIKINFRWLTLCLFGILLALGTTARAQDPRWMTSNSWAGNGILQTKRFFITGERTVLHHTHDGKGLFLVELVNDQNVTAETLISTRNTLSGRVYSRPSGNYYLRINAPNDWTLRMDQYLSLINEWHLLQAMKTEVKPSKLIATWTGEQGVTTYDVNVTKPNFMVKCMNLGGGRVHFQVQNRLTNEIPLSSVSNKSEEFEGWVYATGDFLIKVDAFNSEWKIEVYAE